MKKIYLASDHGGFKLKKKIALFLAKKKFDVTDMGPFKLDMNDDYPDFVIPLAKQVVKSRGSLGVVFCRNGQGVCIATNKVKGIRSVTGFSVKEAKTTRKDDNANVLCIPSDYLTEVKAKKIILTWLGTSFSNATRHKRRLAKVKKIEI
jgi:ribose 5-phosphate isomerase B